MDRVKGKIAIVTGGSSGIGKDSAIMLAKEGAKVVICDISEDAGQEVVNQIRNNGGEALFLKLDVSNEKNWEEVIAATLAKFGKLDVLVNNAGIASNNPIFKLTLEEWRRVMSINLDGVFLGLKHGILAMSKTGGGSIINMSSTGGLIGMANASAYSASKGGVRLLTKSAALECSKANYDFNIRVNSIHPGTIKTPILELVLKHPGLNESLLAKHPIGHLGEGDDVAYGVVYLASDESKFVTGSELVIDGGWTCQ